MRYAGGKLAKRRELFRLDQAVLCKQLRYVRLGTRNLLAAIDFALEGAAHAPKIVRTAADFESTGSEQASLVRNSEPGWADIRAEAGTSW